jgi:hypothetical protein
VTNFCITQTSNLKKGVEKEINTIQELLNFVRKGRDDVIIVRKLTNEINLTERTKISGCKAGLQVLERYNDYRE